MPGEAEIRLRERLANRKGHFMNPGLLHSQFETLEPPEGGFAVVIEIPAERREAAEPEPIAPRIVAAAS